MSSAAPPPSSEDHPPRELPEVDFLPAYGTAGTPYGPTPAASRFDPARQARPVSRRSLAALAFDPQRTIPRPPPRLLDRPKRPSFEPPA